MEDNTKSSCVFFRVGTTTTEELEKALTAFLASITAQVRRSRTHLTVCSLQWKTSEVKDKDRVPRAELTVSTGNRAPTESEKPQRKEEVVDQFESCCINGRSVLVSEGPEGQETCGEVATASTGTRSTPGGKSVRARAAARN